jgi:fermentation-respiration switch protein FrsA (DUF1100 family)
MRTDIAFVLEGRTLRGWLYRPDATADAAPAIVMAHGFSAVKEQYLDRYAAVFRAAGFGVLVYDHANLEASDGLPRQEVDPVGGRHDMGTLARSAEQEFGVPFSLWRRQARILAALPILAGGGSVTDAALTLGYASPSAFAGMFRRQVGAPPSAFRLERPSHRSVAEIV